MGGRGSCLAFKHIQANDNRPGIFSNWDDPESELQTDIFKELKKQKISTRESTDSIDDKVLERQQRQILTISKQYNKILNNTTSKQDIQIGSEVLSGGTLGYCSTTLIDGKVCQRVVLDKKQLENYDKITNAVDKGVKNKWFVPINTMFKSRDYIVTHEMGHAVENGIIAKIAKEKNIDYMSNHKQLQIDVQKEVLKIYHDDFTKQGENDNIYLSKYSTYSAGEWFAETFTNLQLADKPEKISLALQKYLRRFE